MSNNKVNFSSSSGIVHDEGADSRLLPTVPNNGKSSDSGSVTFSEALAQTGFGKANYFLIFVAGMVLANVLLETTGIGFVLPVAQCDMDLSNVDKGILSAVAYVGIIISSHLWGFLADTRGRRTVMRPTLLICFVITFLSSFSHKFWIMVLLRFFSGFFVSGGSATIYAYLGEFHTDKRRSRAMMGSAFIFAIGAMIMPMITFLVINREWSFPIPILGIIYKPWRFFIIVAGTAGLLCGLSLYILPESPKFLHSIGKTKEAMAVLQKLHSWNGVKKPLTFTNILPDENDMPTYATQLANEKTKRHFIVVFLQSMWTQTVPLFSARFLRTTLIACTLQFWLFVGTNGLYMWFPYIINRMAMFMNEHPGEHKKICDIIYDVELARMDTDNSTICRTKLENKTFFYSLIMEITYASMFAFIGLVINRVGKITVLFTTTIFFSCCGLVAVSIPYTSVAAYFYVFFFLVGVGINILGAATVELYPTNLRAMAICISLMIGRIGSVVGANLVGVFLSNFCEWTFYFTCSALILCAFLVLFLPRKISPDTNLKTQPGSSQQSAST